MLLTSDPKWYSTNSIKLLYDKFIEVHFAPVTLNTISNPVSISVFNYTMILLDNKKMLVWGGSALSAVTSHLIILQNLFSFVKLSDLVRL